MQSVGTSRYNDKAISIMIPVADSLEVGECTTIHFEYLMGHETSGLNVLPTTTSTVIEEETLVNSIDEQQQLLEDTSDNQTIYNIVFIVLCSVSVALIIILFAYTVKTRSQPRQHQNKRHEYQLSNISSVPQLSVPQPNTMNATGQMA